MLSERFGTTPKMQTTTVYEFGDVVLVAFPFTNQTATKKRPATVVSSTAYNLERSDIVLMAITSQISTGIIGEVQVIEWARAGLLKPSAIKPVLTTIEKVLVLRKLGRLQEVDRQSLRNTLRLVLG